MKVVEHTSCEVRLNRHSFAFLHAKKAKMNHTIRLGEHPTGGSQDLPVPRLNGESAFVSIESAIRELRAGRMTEVWPACRKLSRFCEIHDLKMISIADLVRYRIKRDYEGFRSAAEGLFPASV